MGDSILTKVNPWIAAGEAIANPLMAHLTNVKNRKFTREMYKTQRTDALHDWEMQNAYNSPAAQMKRFKDAGLNPHLIYGQGNEANPVRSSSSSGGGASAPEFRNPVPGIVGTEKLSAQADLTGEVMRADIDLKKVQQYATLINAGLKDVQIRKALFDLGVATELRDTTIETKKFGLESAKTKLQLAVNEDARRTIMNMTNVNVAAERIATLQKGRAKTDADIRRIEQQIELMKKDGTIKDFDIKWRASGHNPSDPGVIKIWDSIMDRLGFGSDRIGKAIESEIHDIPKIFTPKRKPWMEQNPTKYRATDSQ